MVTVLCILEVVIQNTGVTSQRQKTILISARNVTPAVDFNYGDIATYTFTLRASPPLKSIVHNSVYARDAIGIVKPPTVLWCARLRRKETGGKIHAPIGTHDTEPSVVNQSLPTPIQPKRF